MSSSKIHLQGYFMAGVYQSLSGIYQISCVPQSVCWNFLPSFVYCCPSHLLSGSTLPPSPPSLCQSTVHTDSVWLGAGGRGGIESCWRPYSAGVQHSVSVCIWPDSEPTKLKIARPPKQKPRRGGGLRQMNTHSNVSLQVIFLDDDILLLCLYS